VGQDGILRLIGNRPFANRFASSRLGRFRPHGAANHDYRFLWSFARANTPQCLYLPNACAIAFSASGPIMSYPAAVGCSPSAVISALNMPLSSTVAEK
jgi:hypothetical protein